ncbi:MAG TPA: methylated-DNA--[protein]-cysteine S-methyltransferase [Solirubrobacteraceae bacterium]|nr:methylated-DNA--[protein]-cysteine S-methyltransferase [Solirubrobacteraceae bacterium]
MDELEVLLGQGVAGPDRLPDLGPAAAEAGLLDVAYAIEDFPVGRLLLAVTRRGLVRIAYLDGDERAEEVLEGLADQISPRVLAARARLDEPRRELEEFFAGRRQQFELPLDWRLVRPGFGRRVLQATSRIPFGNVSSYKLVAGEAGSPRAYRAAGTALSGNPIPIVVPCHRVLHTGGGLGGYTGGLEKKVKLLSLEGMLF